MRAEQSGGKDVLPVGRSKTQARTYYDRLAPFYRVLGGGFERRPARTALGRLGVAAGETVLEVGCGPGEEMVEMARRVGPDGCVYGLDLSHRMLIGSRRRLAKAGLTDRSALCRGDGAALPYAADSFDAVFLAFTLELFETEEIPAVLAEVARVLRPTGRVGVVSLSREGRGSPVRRLYEWVHRRWPRLFDCRPIYVRRSVEQAGYTVAESEEGSMAGLPVEIVVGKKRAAGA
ncbi:MAG: class I SAM-dependent methyltransferase [Chloroflexota bacterium]